MTRPQENIRSMWLTLLAVLMQHQDSWTNRVPFVRRVNELRQAVKDMDLPSMVQGRDDRGITEDKAALKLEAATQADVVGDIIQAYAMDQENHELYRKMQFGSAELAIRADTLAKDKMNEVHQLGTDLTVDVLGDYGLSEDMLTHLRKAIDAYAAKIAAPRTATVERTGGTRSIAEAVIAGQAARTNILKQLSSFRATNPEMVQQVTKAAVIVDNKGGQAADDADAPAA